MFRRTASSIAIASAVMMVAAGALATPALADGGAVAPKQYFYGEVFGLSTSGNSDVISVDCTAAALFGHPFANQYVAAHQIFPPLTTTAGYTGNVGDEIVVSLEYASATGLPPIIGTLGYYDQKLEIPTSSEVPCSGTGVMVFAPNPDDGTGVPSKVDVTFN